MMVLMALTEPMGDYTDLNAMIYPFKKMIGNQDADVVNNRIMVPHLFGWTGDPAVRRLFYFCCLSIFGRPVRQAPGASSRAP